VDRQVAASLGAAALSAALRSSDAEAPAPAGAAADAARPTEPSVRVSGDGTISFSSK
jgi:hypothetical protein